MEINKLIDSITDEIYKQIYFNHNPGEQACHTVCIDEDAQRFRLFIECGVDRIGGLAKKPRESSNDLARYIDHTLLKPTACRSEIEQLCREADEFGFASVCVNPFWVKTARLILNGSRVAVCTVVGFPLGAQVQDTKTYETRRAIFDGAVEIDMVVNIGALKSGDDSTVLQEIKAIADICHESGAICKVIIETAALTDDEKVKACTLAKEAGADFVKTSTGFGGGGATAEDVALMRRVVGSGLGVKASGGIKDREQTQQMIEAGATRIGASAGIKIVQNQQPAESPKTY